MPWYRRASLSGLQEKAKFVLLWSKCYGKIEATQWCIVSPGLCLDPNPSNLQCSDPNPSKLQCSKQGLKGSSPPANSQSQLGHPPNALNFQCSNPSPSNLVLYASGLSSSTWVCPRTLCMVAQMLKKHARVCNGIDAQPTQQILNINTQIHLHMCTRQM